MEDKAIIEEIDHLAREEHRLERAHADTGLNPQEQDQLHSIEVALDQCWDLLRQRRARRRAGAEPDDAQPRPGSVVEGYQQ